MSRASRARRIAATAAVGGGGLAGLGAAGWGVLLAEARLARRWIGQPFGLVAPDASGRYEPPPRKRKGGTRGGEPLRLAMIGDSSAAGLGVDEASQTPGALIATGVARIARRPVDLQVVAVVGAETRMIDVQVDRVLAEQPPQVAVIMVGANDVTHRTSVSASVMHLDVQVRRLRAAGVEVVLASCPDLGTIKPIAQPLRWVARRWSRQLAAAQTITVVEAGGRSVSLGDLLGPEFSQRPDEMFSSDRFHPSAAGYERAAAALLPSVCDALGLATTVQASTGRLRRGAVDDVAHAAVRAAESAGTEVSGTDVAGATRGPRGRWAILRRRSTSSAAEAGLQELATDENSTAENSTAENSTADESAAGGSTRPAAGSVPTDGVSAVTVGSGAATGSDT